MIAIIIILSILAIQVSGIAWIIWGCSHAKPGYEDKSGFHEGKEP